MQPQSTPTSARSALYLRVSSSKQDDGYSPEIQERDCRSYAAAQLLDVVAVYRETHTGTELWERPELTRLRAAMARGEYAHVIVHSLDRLSRDPVHQQIVFVEAAQYGVTMHSTTEAIDDTDIGRLMQYLHGWKAKDEHAAIRRRTRAGRQARAAAGKLISRPKALYGYRFADADHARYIVNEPEAKIVRRMVDACLAGQPINRIRVDLNADAIPSPSGKATWSHTTIHRILTTRDYTGRGANWRGEFDLPEGVIPQLVTDAEHAAILERLRVNKQFSQRNTIAPDAALLRAGFVRCGYCGKVAHTVTSHDRLLYRCYGHADQVDPCPGAAIPVERLDGIVWQRIYAALTDEGVVERELTRLLRDDPTCADADAVERTIRQVEKQQQNLTRAVAMFDDDDDSDALALLVADLKRCAARLVDLRAERDAVAARRAHWQQALERLHDVRRHVADVGARLDSFSWEQKRVALAAVKAQVTLYRPDHEPPYRVQMLLPLDDETVSHSTCPADVSLAQRSVLISWSAADLVVEAA